MSVAHVSVLECSSNSDTLQQVDCTALDAALKSKGTAAALVPLEGAQAVAVVGAGGAGIYTFQADSKGLHLLSAVSGMSLMFHAQTGRTHFLTYHCGLQSALDSSGTNIR